MNYINPPQHLLPAQHVQGQRQPISADHHQPGNLPSDTGIYTSHLASPQRQVNPTLHSNVNAAHHGHNTSTSAMHSHSHPRTHHHHQQQHQHQQLHHQQQQSALLGAKISHRHMQQQMHVPSSHHQLTQQQQQPGGQMHRLAPGINQVGPRGIASTYQQQMQQHHQQHGMQSSDIPAPLHQAHQLQHVGMHHSQQQHSQQQHSHGGQMHQPPATVMHQQHAHPRQHSHPPHMGTMGPPSMSAIQGRMMTTAAAEMPQQQQQVIHPMDANRSLQASVAQQHPHHRLPQQHDQGRQQAVSSASHDHRISSTNATSAHEIHHLGLPPPSTTPADGAPRHQIQAQVTAAAASAAPPQQMTQSPSANVASVPMGSDVTAQEIATAFAFQYYQTLSAVPGDAHRFYLDESLLTRGSTAIRTWEFQRHVGVTPIDSVLKDCLRGLRQALLHAVEGQPSMNGTIFVLMLGVLHFDDESERPFTHAVLLVPIPHSHDNDGSQPCYYVMNDVFVFNEGPPDDDSDVLFRLGAPRDVAALGTVTTATNTSPIEKHMAPSPAVPERDPGFNMAHQTVVTPEHEQQLSCPLEEEQQHDDDAADTLVDPIDEQTPNDFENRAVETTPHENAERVVQQPIIHVVQQPIERDDQQPIETESAPLAEAVRLTPLRHDGRTSWRAEADAVATITAPRPQPQLTQSAAPSPWTRQTAAAVPSSGPSLRDSSRAADESRTTDNHGPQATATGPPKPSYAENSYAGRLLHHGGPSEAQVKGYVKARELAAEGVTTTGRAGSPEGATLASTGTSKTLFIYGIPQDTTDDVLESAINRSLKGGSSEGHVVSIERPETIIGAATVTLDTELCSSILIKKGLYVNGTLTKIKTTGTAGADRREYRRQAGGGEQFEGRRRHDQNRENNAEYEHRQPYAYRGGMESHDGGYRGGRVARGSAQPRSFHRAPASGREIGTPKTSAPVEGGWEKKVRRRGATRPQTGEPVLHANNAVISASG